MNLIKNKPVHTYLVLVQEGNRTRWIGFRAKSTKRLKVLTKDLEVIAYKRIEKESK